MLLPGSEGDSTLCLIVGEKLVIETQEGPIPAADGQEHNCLYSAGPRAGAMDVGTSKPGELQPFPTPKTCIEEQLPFHTLALPLNLEIFPQGFKF